MARKIDITSEKEKSLLKRIWSDYGRPNIKMFALGAFVLMIGSLLQAGAVAMLKHVFDDAFKQNSMIVIVVIAAQIAGLYFLNSILSYWGGLIISKTSLLSVNSLRKRLMDKYLSLDMKFFDQNNSAFFTSRMIGDCDSIISIISTSVVTVFKQLVTCIAMIVLMLYYSWFMSLVAFIFIPLGFLSIRQIMNRSKKISTSLKNEGQNLFAKLVEALQGFKIIKSYGMEKVQYKEVVDVLDKQTEILYKAARVSGRSGPIMEGLSGVVIAAIIIVGGYLISKGTMTMGEFVTFLTAWIAAFKPLKAVGQFAVNIQNGIVSAERVYSVLDEKAKVKDKKNALELDGLKKSIVLKNVVFSYDDKKNALNSVNLEVPVGKTVALVGASGGGKSTVLSLVLRLYDPQAGQILIDGIDIKEYSQKSIRKNIAFVSQDVLLFDDSIRNNIAVGYHDDFRKVADDKIVEAAKKAYADEFIRELPGGYEAQVGEAGKRLSGGQKQRISIARAIIKDAPIVLLDEATSALDTESEKKVQEAFEAMSKGKTSIVIAHRLSTIVDADLIYVINEGQVVESGNHKDLSVAGGFYENLCKTQFRANKKY